MFLMNQYNTGILCCFLLLLLPCFSSTFRQTNDDNTRNVSEDCLLFSRIQSLHHLLWVDFHDEEDESISSTLHNRRLNILLVQHQSKFFPQKDEFLWMSWQNLVFVVLLWPLIGLQSHLHSIFARSGKRRKTVAKCLCTRMRMFSVRSDLSSRRLCAEMYVTVMSTVPGCDVTTVQQHYTGSTSTPPRVARLCQIREASLVALRKFSKIYACSYPEISTVTRRHCIIWQVNSSRSAQYPCQALISICGIYHVPALSFRCHSDSHRS